MPFPSFTKEMIMATDDTAKIRAELEALQLAELREQAEERKAARAARLLHLKTVAQALQMSENARRILQNRCAHRKGGKNLEQFFDGNDPNYAVIKHTLSHGPTIIICQRCQRVWEPPAPLNPEATTAQRKEWEAEMAEYRRALAFTTDNEPSGAVIFDQIPNYPIPMHRL